MTPVIEARGLRKDYQVRRRGDWSKRSFSAISDVDLAVNLGETLCIVGESGCGKSTLARVLAGLTPPSAGTVLFNGQDISRMTSAARHAMRRWNQFIFQDPYASLNPRWTLGRIIAEPLENFTDLGRVERHDRAKAMLEKVGLRASDIDRLPKELSGGQRQRVGIARAIVSEPRLVIADEAVSALDVSVKAQVLNLLMELQAEIGMAYIVITHDVGVVRSIADRLMVMYLGRVMETGPADRLLDFPRHPYTQRLISAVPVPDPRRRMEMTVSSDEVPSALDPPSGCVFRTRCNYATDVCRSLPRLQGSPSGTVVACHFPHVNSKSTRDPLRAGDAGLSGRHEPPHAI